MRALLLGLIPAIALAQPKADPDAPQLVIDTGGHSGRITGVAFAADGTVAVTTGHDKTVRVWDLVTGDTLRVIRPPAGPGPDGILNALAVAPDGKTIAVGGLPPNVKAHGYRIYLIDVTTGRITKTLNGHTDSITCLSFGPAGRRLASGSLDKTVRLYDVPGGKTEAVLTGHTAGVRAVAFSPGGDAIASVGEDKTCRLWTVPEGQSAGVLKDEDRPAASVAWAPGGRTLAVGNLDGSVSLWDAAGKYRSTLKAVGGAILSLTYTPDGREFLCTGYDPVKPADTPQKAARMVDAGTGKERVKFGLHSDAVLVGAVSADGKLAITGGGNHHEAFAWRVADATMAQPLYGRGGGVFAAGWQGDGKAIGWGNRNRVGGGRAPLERSFLLDEFKLGPTGFLIQNGFVRDLPIREDRAIDVKDGKLYVLDDDEVISTFQPDRDLVRCATWLDDDLVVVGTAFGLYLVDPKTGKSIRRYVGHAGEVTSIGLSPEGQMFVTGSRDQTIRLWSAERNRPVLSLFVAAQDWIAWTEEGVYTCSANGERLMGWQVTGGPDAVASYFPAAQFRRSLFKPTVVPHVVPEGGLDKAFAAAELEKPDDLDVRKLLPPRVEITAPAGLGTQRVAGTKFEVAARAEAVGGRPVTAMRLLVNGRPYGGDAGVKAFEKPAAGPVDAKWDVTLPAGPYTLAVVADSAVSRAVSAPVDIRVPGKDDRPALYVLAVGVNEYIPGLKLRYAASDADAIAKAFQTSGAKAFKSVEVKVLKDKDATGRGIADGIAWLGTKLTPQDVGVLFFSGHGGRDFQGDFALLPADVDPDNLDRTCVPGLWLKAALGALPGRVVALLDACHAGLAADRLPGSAEDNLVRDLVSEDYGVAIMSSSHAAESSIESGTVKHGFFTKALIEGLAGQADYNKDGVILFGELDRYTRARVNALSRGQQHPTTAKPATLRSFPLAKP